MSHFQSLGDLVVSCDVISNIFCRFLAINIILKTNRINVCTAYSNNLAHQWRKHANSSFQWRHNGAIVSQIISLTIVYSTVYTGADQRKHQNSASLAFVWGIHRGPVNSPHKGPVTRKIFLFDDVIMIAAINHRCNWWEMDMRFSLGKCD